MAYIFRTFRKPLVGKQKEVLEGTIELRKLMGWTGMGAITQGFTNPTGFISHFRRFETLDEISEWLDFTKPDKKVIDKVYELNSICEMYANKVFKVIKPMSGVSGNISDYLKGCQIQDQWILHCKVGERQKVIDACIEQSENFTGIKPNVSTTLSSPMIGDVFVTRVLKSFNEIEDEGNDKTAPDFIKKVKDSVTGFDRHQTLLHHD
tara:strand:- start:143 stop:763 length:621 start_codon:yes stop_codon:yes gene_type:complete